MENITFDNLKTRVAEQLRFDKPLLGKDSTLEPLQESIVNSILEGEMDAHLTQD